MATNIIPSVMQHQVRSIIRCTILFCAMLFAAIGGVSAQPSRRIDTPPKGGERDSLLSAKPFEYIEQKADTMINFGRLNGTPKPPHDTLFRISNTPPVYCAARVLHGASIKVKLERGDDYLFGAQTFSADVIFKLEEKNSSNINVFRYDSVRLHIDQDNPEQLFQIDYKGTDLSNYKNVKYFQTRIYSFPHSGSVTGDVRLRISYKDEYAISAVDSTNPATKLVAVDSLDSLPGPIIGNPVNLRWHIKTGCSDTFPNYQVQLLRLYNIDTSYNEDSKVRAVVDWNQALSVETGNGSRRLPLTIAEGTGYYVWRVRPIGNVYDGGIADDRNWGAWSTAPPNDSIVNFVDPNTTLPKYLFYYRQFNDSMNWAYSRGFDEGGRISEGMVFTNSALQPRQSQVHVHVGSRDTILASQTIYDYVGRPAAASLTAPIRKLDSLDYFGYVDTLLSHNDTLFSAAQFDGDSNYLNPQSANTGMIADRYSNSNGDTRIPNADAYPYARARYASDGTSRVEEAGGPGQVYRIGGGALGKDRTVRSYYGSVSNQELINLFGDEAPSDTSVIKVLTVDPNKVVTVAYMSKDGGVIASGLVRTQGDTLLQPLDETERLQFTVSDTVSGNRAQDKYTFGSTKRLAFAGDTTLTIRYKITPDTLSDHACGTSICSTCDYSIRVALHNIDEPDSSREITILLPPTGCDSVRTIDTTITVHVHAGTYIIERLASSNTIDTASITPANPYGASFAARYRARMAGIITDSIRQGTHDTLNKIDYYLSIGKIDSLYDYLDVDPAHDSVKVIHAGCCDIRIPIIKPDCIPYPCFSGIDFEAYLRSKWKTVFTTGGSDTANLNKYFWGGESPIYPSGDVTYPNGAGAFNKLIQNMLADTAGGVHHYDTCTLWTIWRSFVGNLRQYGTIDNDPTNHNLDFNLLDEFLEAAGKRYEDVSSAPYNATSGYLLFAYKRIHYTIGDNTHCEGDVGYSSSWIGQPDSSDHWNDLYSCVRASDRTTSSGDNPFSTCMGGSLSAATDTCSVRLKRSVEQSAIGICEQRLGEFHDEVVAAYHRDGNYSFADEDAWCAASNMVDSCRALCHLTLHYNGDGRVDTVGKQSDFDNLKRVYGYSPSVTIKGMGSCPDSTVLYEGLTVEYSKLIVQFLNQRIVSYRIDSVGIDGGYWNIKRSIRSYVPSMASTISGDSLVFVRYDDTSAHFELRSNGSGDCALWFVADTLFCGDSAHPHPLVTHLNNYLDMLWGMAIDTTGDTVWDYCNFNSVDARWYSSSSLNRGFSDLNQTYLNSVFSCVNGRYLERPMSDYIDIRNLGYTYAYRTDSTHPFKIGKIDLIACGDEIHSELEGFGCLAATDPSIIRHRVTRDCGTVVTNSGIGIGANPSDSINFSFSRPYTQLYGKFGESADHYLLFYNYRYTSGFINPDSANPVKVFGIRFYSTFDKELTDNICSTKVCPSICFRWVPRKDSALRIDTVKRISCRETALQMIHDAVYQQIGACVDAQVAGLEAHYDAVCGNGDSLKDEFILQYPIDYYHFTLFYYDRSGNVVKVVAPKGVKANPTGTGDPTRMDHPAHTYITEYDYNSLGQVVRTRTPDGDTSRVWYDQWGRPRFSQDQAQKANLRYSYVKYDYLGRVVETGESGQAGGGAFANAGNINNSSFPATGTEQTFTTYTDSSGISYLDNSPQHNLRNRVSLVETSSGVKTHYSYDVHGSVEWVAQEIPGLLQKNYTHYTYELISGNMQQVDYNDGKIDQFHHRYSYDKDGRLTSVETSRDGRIWDRDAGYSYAATGELKRRELGEDKLAGLDYTYTLQGALKAVNAPSLKSADDPGQDGTANTYAPDSFAVALSYYPGDFARSGSVLDSSKATGLRGPPLFDGNISSTTSHLGDSMQLKYRGLTGETYRYDQLGRLKSSTFRPFDSATSHWDTTSQYATSYAYDPNGNIDSLRRNAYTVSGAMAMDSLRYRYVTAGSGEPTNKLDRVQDAVAGKPYTDDISSGQTTGNYQYDANGRLTADASENGMAVTWTHDGKVSKITSTAVVGGTSHHMQMDYLYDGGGNCVRKSVSRWIGTGTKSIEHTYYVYGADGNVMAIYQQTCEKTGGARRGDGGSMSARGSTGGGRTPVTKASKKDDRSLQSVDTDGDGIDDDTDNCPLIYNPGQADFDRDGVGDGCDNCIGKWNPHQEDLNHNGFGDVCEDGWCFGDIDGDGCPNCDDPCPYVFDADPSHCANAMPPVFPPDADNDSIPDMCDNCPNLSNYSQRDRDGDGVGDACDNCPTVINGDQADADSNGVGDACDWFGTDCTVHLVEFPIYGIEREGTLRVGSFNLAGKVPDTIFTRKLNERMYELRDHLGDARMIISDRKLSTVSGGVPGAFRWQVLSSSNIYPFGMEEPGRYNDGSGYRYGYNGMERDSQVTTGHYSTYFRQYDARLGRWWGIDPVDHPGESPYMAMGDNPIVMVDPMGDEDGPGDKNSGESTPADPGPWPGPVGSGGSEGSGSSPQWPVGPGLPGMEMSGFDGSTWEWRNFTNHTPMWVKMMPAIKFEAQRAHPYEGIEFWEKVDIRGDLPHTDFSESSIDKIGEYTITKSFVRDGGLIIPINYEASRTVHGRVRTEFIIGADDLEDFRQHIGLITASANMFYVNGTPSKPDLMVMAGMPGGFAARMKSEFSKPEAWNMIFLSLLGGAGGGAVGEAGEASTIGIGSTAPAGGEMVNLASADATEHILYGNSTGGGHMFPGLPGKSVFPEGWSEDLIMHHVSDIATDPNITWNIQTGNGGFFTKAGVPARFSAFGIRDGISIRVVISPMGGGIITGFPATH